MTIELLTNRGIFNRFFKRNTTHAAFEEFILDYWWILKRPLIRSVPPNF